MSVSSIVGLLFIFIIECSAAAKYTDWGSWSGCASTCQTGSEPVYRYRIRHCEEEGLGSGFGCEEDDLITKFECDVPQCPVDGAWGPWSRWSACTASCYGGSRARTRRCDQPAPSFGGRYCEGYHELTTVCQEIPCPVAGYLTAWTAWMPCPDCVRNMTTERSRECIQPQHGGTPCPEGDLKEQRDCVYDLDNCPSWSTWSDWGLCPLPVCDKRIARVYRSRHCKNIRRGMECEGENEESKTCTTFTSTCPVDGKYGEWQEWEHIDGLCQRSRECIGRLNGGKTCKEQNLGDGSESKVSRDGDCDGPEVSGDGSGSGSGEDSESGSGAGEDSESGSG